MTTGNRQEDKGKSGLAQSSSAGRNKMNFFHSSTYVILTGSTNTTSPRSTLPKLPRAYAGPGKDQPSWEAAAGAGVCYLPRYLGLSSCCPGLIPAPCSPCFPLWLQEVLSSQMVVWVLERLAYPLLCFVLGLYNDQAQTSMEPAVSLTKTSHSIKLFHPNSFN